MLAKKLDLLLKLQEIEIKQNELETILKNHPGKKHLCKLKKDIEEIETEYNNKYERLTAVKKELIRTDMKSKQLSEELKQLEERLYSGHVQTMKELKKIQGKQENLKKEMDETVDKALELMEEIEELKNMIPEQQENMLKMKKEYNQYRLKTKEEIDKINTEKTNILLKKQEIVKNITADILGKYERIKRQKLDPVALISEGRCTGCRMDVSVMVAQEVNRHEKLIYCESCGRILI